MELLLLRGLAREQRHWSRFPDVLAAALPNARVRGLDLPGAGTEHARRSPARIRDITSDLRARFLATRGPGPTVLLGVSLGGMVAMDWAGTWPQDFAAVVLVNTSAADLSPPWRRMSPRVLPGLLRALASTDPVARELRVLGFTTRMQSDPRPIAERHARFAAERPMTRMTVVRQLVAASRFRAPPAISIPTLVVAGAEDPLANPACARLLADRFAAPLAVHPRAGHDLALDDPDWLAAEVRAFLDRAGLVSTMMEANPT